MSLVIPIVIWLAVTPGPGTGVGPLVVGASYEGFEDLPMLYLTIKAALSGVIIAIGPEVARRSPTLGALIVSLIAWRVPNDPSAESVSLIRVDEISAMRDASVGSLRSPISTPVFV